MAHERCQEGVRYQEALSLEEEGFQDKSGLPKELEL